MAELEAHPSVEEGRGVGRKGFKGETPACKNAPESGHRNAREQRRVQFAMDQIAAHAAKQKGSRRLDGPGWRRPRLIAPHASAE